MSSSPSRSPSNFDARAERHRLEQAARVEKIAKVAADLATTPELTNVMQEVLFPSDGSARDVAGRIAGEEDAAREALCALIRRKGSSAAQAIAGVAAVVAAQAGYVVMLPPEPSPAASNGRSVWEEVQEDLAAGTAASVFVSGMEDLVAADMKERDMVGRERYGTPLQAHNGRDALKDSYDEALDHCAYRRQALDESVDGPIGFDDVRRLAESIDQANSAKDVDRCVLAQSYIVALTMVLKTREQIERRRGARTDASAQGSLEEG